MTVSNDLFPFPSFYFSDQYMSRLFGQYFQAVLFDNDNEFEKVSQDLLEISKNE